MSIGPAETVRIGALDWTVHPTIWLPDEQWLRDQYIAQANKAVQSGIGKQQAMRAAEVWIEDFCKEREKRIRQEKYWPSVYGWENPIWKVLRGIYGEGYRVGSIGTATPDATDQLLTGDDILFIAGNRGGKTEFGGKIVNEILRSGERKIARCWSQNQKTSRGEQQPMLFKYLETRLKKVKKEGAFTKISYTMATGFSEDTYVLPSQSQCWLLTYNAWRQDKTAAEGGEADIIWCDEEVPAELLDTLRFRTGARQMKLLVTFTPISGYSEACAQYLEGATVVETIPARDVIYDAYTGDWRWGEWLLDSDRQLVPGCPHGHVPLILRHDQVKGRFAVTMPTPFNPYIDKETVLKKARSKPLEYRMTRWFGWPTKRAQKAFPRFGRWHIVEREKLPNDQALTIYLLADPHGRRNWFLLWVGIDMDGTIWAIDEWPRASVEGDWAIPGDKPDGKVGEGQFFESGKSFVDYKKIILTMEGWQRTDAGGVERGAKVREVDSRYMDPRPAGTTVPSDSEGWTYLDHMASEHKEGEKVIVPGLDFAAAPGCKIEEGTQLIRDWLTRDWNPDEPVTPLNCPRFYVSAHCSNLIYALKNWTGEDGEKGACKDPIDCLKAAAKLGMMEQGDLDKMQPAGRSFSY